jgi:hypothetical protein
MFSSRKMQSSGWMRMPISCAMAAMDCQRDSESRELAFHEGDAAVAEIVEMAKRHAGGGVVIEHDVGDAGRLAVRGDADDGGGNVEGELRVDEEKAIDAAAHEEFLIPVFEVGLAEMAYGEVEEAFLEKILLDA